MTDITDSSIRNRFVFLNDHHSKEPYIYEVISEIYNWQTKFLKGGSEQLCTLEVLKESKKIKIPISPTRHKTISYLVEILLKYYPDIVKPVVTFSFIADPATKSLSIKERQELTLLLTGEQYKAVKKTRDEESKKNIIELFASFRLFNLTKLLKKTGNRQYLSGLIKEELGKNIFTYKIHFLDKHNIENSEDVCFHKKNYESVKNEIDLAFLKKTVSAYGAPVSRHLKKFGLINADFGDYRDSKIDYLLTILLDSMTHDLSRKELIELKNFKSLRNCILKVDNVLDPMVTLEQDIVKHIKNSYMTTPEEITQLFDGINEEKLYEWIEDNSANLKLITMDLDGSNKIISTSEYIAKLSELRNLILFNQEEFQKLSHSEKTGYIQSMNALCRAGEVIINEIINYKHILDESDTETIQQTIKDYKDYKNRISRRDEHVREQVEKKAGRSIFGAIADFFKGLFSKSIKHSKDITLSTSNNIHNKTYIIPGETRDIYREILQRNAKLIPLSDYIELSIENNNLVDSIINTLRKNNDKIVVPVYNARKNLYPKKSQNYMLEDVEYLLIDPEVAATGETIRSFTDSLNGYKIKDETVPGVAILSIEKYLLSLYRQKRKKKK